MSWIHTQDTKPKARKAYACELCAQSIPVGTIHVARTGIIEVEGRVTMRFHIDCERYTAVNFRDDGDWECTEQSAFSEVINARIPISPTTTL